MPPSYARLSPLSKGRIVGLREAGTPRDDIVEVVRKKDGKTVLTWRVWVVNTLSGVTCVGWHVWIEKIVNTMDTQWTLNGHLMDTTMDTQWTLVKTTCLTLVQLKEINIHNYSFLRNYRWLVIPSVHWSVHWVSIECPLEKPKPKCQNKKLQCVHGTGRELFF